MSNDKQPPRADGRPNTQALRIYALRTNEHFTLKKNPLASADLQDFVACYRTGVIAQGQETDEHAVKR